MIRSSDITYEPINGNDLVCRVKIKGELIGYVFFQKKEGEWIFQRLEDGKYTKGLTRTIAVGKSLLNNLDN